MLSRLSCIGDQNRRQGKAELRVGTGSYHLRLDRCARQAGKLNALIPELADKKTGDEQKDYARNQHGKDVDSGLGSAMAPHDLIQNGEVLQSFWVSPTVRW
jgi:hypothetical protein